MQKAVPVITIDGPSGTGKGTICQLLAQELSWNLLDSGALYRVLAMAAQNHGVECAARHADSLAVLAEHLDVQFKATGAGDTPRVILEGEDVTTAIRAEEIGNLASKIGALPEVRTALLNRQRAFRETPGLVTDGRDMGTVVFPDAILKVYLDASVEERAQRRYKQLKDKGINVNLLAVSGEIAERDRRDTERAVAPLKAAKGALSIDTTAMSISEVLDRVLREARRKISETERLGSSS